MWGKLPKGQIVNWDSRNDLAYFLGVMKGDGCIYRDNATGYLRMQIRVTSRPFIESISSALAKVGLTPAIYPVYQNLYQKDLPRKQQWGISIFCQELATWYKALTLSEVEGFCEGPKMKSEFIRGFYESEGSVCTRPKDKRRNARTHVTMTNTQPELLACVQRMLIALGIHFNFGGPFSSKSRISNKTWVSQFFNLNASAKMVVRSFFETVKPVIKTPASDLLAIWDAPMVYGVPQVTYFMLGYYPVTGNVLAFVGVHFAVFWVSFYVVYKYLK